MGRLDYFSEQMFDCCYDYLGQDKQREVRQAAQHYDDRQAMCRTRDEHEEQFYNQYEDE
jgi:hypothetical protein